MKPIQALSLAVALASSALALGCNSTSVTNPGATTSAQIQAAEAAVTSTFDAANSNDANEVLGQAGYRSLLGKSGVLEALRAPRPGGAGGRAFAAIPLSGKAAVLLPTGSYRIVGAAALKFSDVPHDGLFVIGRSIAAAADSDSVRMSNVLYHHSVLNTLPQAYQLDIYAAHPTAPVTDHHVARFGFRAHYGFLDIPDSLYVDRDFTQLANLNMALAANFSAGEYTARFAATNYRRSNQSISMDYAVRGTGSVITGNFEPTSSDLTVTHAFSSSTWLTALHYTSIHGDTATVSGEVKRDGTQVATIAGTVYPVPAGQCPPVIITLVATGTQFSFCELFLGIPPGTDLAGLRGSGGGGIGGGGSGMSANWVRAR